ncbi:MAG: hypothetical protein V4772_12740 [Pseudomonadota bacterium]
MKLLVILLLVLFFVALLGARPVSGGAGARQSTRSNWLTSLTILVLRITRGGLALVTVLSVFMAFRLLLVSGVSVHTQAHQANTLAWWVFAGMAAGTAALFYFLFWTLRRIRQRVNQMHAERSHSSRPLLAGNWSF